ncbi:MAG TPA: hypothetical protein VJT15_15510 [Pyrinomonadaceae bacterium]|nr:hypothetical protein [Pyrinomonadaceae bacterium]
MSIHSLGYTYLNIPKLCKLLNSAQRYHKFIPATKITNIGPPDLADYGYSVTALHNSAKPHLQDHSIAALFTSVPIEGNFYAKTIDRKIIIATLHQLEELLEKSGRTIEEYAALTICQELLSFEFQRVSGKQWYDLFHQDPRGCIFDFVGVKSQKIGKLINFSLCEGCLGVLVQSNVSADVLTSIRRILESVVRPSIRKAISECVTKPGWSFIYGGIVLGSVVNLGATLLLNQAALTRAQYWAIVTVASWIILFPLAIYGWQWVRFLKSKMN